MATGGSKCSKAAGSTGESHIAEFELGNQAKDLLHPDFSRWPTQCLRGNSPHAQRIKIYEPIALQSIGKHKIAQEYAFKSLTNQICDAAAAEYAFLE
jgi:hypothetical protein